MIKQPGFFDHTQEDLPLFSGTAPRVKGERFDPKPEVKQESFFDMRPQFNDAKKESPAIIDTTKIPLNVGYTIAKEEIESNPVPFRDRVNAVKDKINKSFREKGYQKAAAAKFTENIVKKYIIYHKYYHDQGLTPGVICIKLLENEVDDILKENDHDTLIELWWNN
jgi:hypothetical protein